MSWFQMKSFLGFKNTWPLKERALIWNLRNLSVNVDHLIQDDNLVEILYALLSKRDEYLTEDSWGIE